MKIFVQNILSFLGFKPQQSVVEKVVDKVVMQHVASLKRLDMYDKGELQQTKDMVNNSTVREYLQKIQRITVNSAP